jgi:DNA polymerase III delta subunit
MLAERHARPQLRSPSERRQRSTVSYLLHGPNTLLVEERLAALRAELDPQTFNTSTIDLQSTTVQEVAAACQASSFFGSGRVLVLRNPVNPRRAATTTDDDASDDTAVGKLVWAEIADALRSAPPENHIIIRQDGTLASNHGAHKLAKDLGWKIETYTIPREGELLAWVSERAALLGLSITHAAQERLLDLLHPLVWNSKPDRFDTSNPDPRLIASELAKLASAAGDAPVDVPLVDELVEDRSGYKAFALNNVLFTGNTSGSLTELEKMLDAGDPAERILAGLASDASLQAAVQLGEGHNPSAVATASGMTEGRIGNLRRNGPRLDPRALQRITEAIRHADASVKSGAAGSTQEEIVPLVAHIAETVRSTRRR